MMERNQRYSRETTASGSAILAWLATTLAMMCVLARLSWTASGLFAGAAIASLVFTMLLSRAAS